MTQGVHGSGMQGASCRRCGGNEQVCAYRQGCCEGCTHWLGYDAAGNEIPYSRPGTWRRSELLVTVTATRRAAIDRALRRLAS